MSAVMTCASCQNGKENADAQDIIQRQEVHITDGRMTPEALWAMGRIGSVAVSPDQQQIAYSVTYYSVPQDKSNTELFVMNTDGSDNRQITRSAFREGEPAWIKEGTKLAFLCNEGGSSQVWEMNPDGTAR